MASSRSILALSGGVGGAKLASGLAQCLSPDELLIVANTADDFRHLGLHIAPDMDSVMYALADRNDQQRGWGLKDESWRCMEQMQAIGGPSWFSLGDKDLATHLLRSSLINDGASLSAASATLCAGFGVAHPLVPMSDDPVQTIVHSVEGRLAFQEYFVARQCEPQVSGFEFEGIAQANPQVDYWRALNNELTSGIIICPSNPFVSVEPLLALSGVRDALAKLTIPIVAVSPIVGGQALKGPAAKMLAELGLEVSALSVAQHYQGLVTHFVLDSVDASLTRDVEALGMQVLVCDSIMRDRASQKALAEHILAWLP